MNVFEGYKLKWSCLLLGDANSIESLKRLVSSDELGGDSYRVIALGDHTYITRLAWWTAKDIDEAFDIISSDLSIVFGALDILERRCGIEMGQIIQITENDDMEMHIRSKGAMARIPKSPADPALFAKLIRCSSHPHLYHAIRDFSGNGTWYEVYNCLEGIMRHFGGEREFLAAFPEKKTSFEKLKETANHHRHSKSHGKTVVKPISLSKAKIMLEDLLEDIANRLTIVSDVVPLWQTLH